GHEVWNSGGEVGAYPAVGSDGTVYLAWDDGCGNTTPLDPTGVCSSTGGQILFAKSIDGGATFLTGAGAPLNAACSSSCTQPTFVHATTTGFGSILPNYGGTCATGCAPRAVVSLP